MKAVTNTVAEAYASWLASVSQCCAPVSNCLQPGSTTNERGSEKPKISIVRDQPGLVQTLHAPDYLYYENEEAVTRPTTKASTRERARKSFSSARTSLSARRRWPSVRGSGGSGRPPMQISAPTNFRHLNSDTFQFPSFDPTTVTATNAAGTIAQPRRASFRPLQLSIYQPENALSPMLPHFGAAAAVGAPHEASIGGVVDAGRVITPPPRARVRGGSDADSTRSRGAMSHERSYSSMSFHVPRRAHPDDSPSFSSMSRQQQQQQQQQQQRQRSPSPPPPPPKARARAYTSPEAERLAERIASALIEKEKLQELIDECVERQSIYLSSRPSTAHSMAFSMTGMEPMPAIPALPPTAPSFAERLSSDRPTTAPARSPMRPRHFEAAADATTPTTATTTLLPLASPASTVTMSSLATPTRVTTDDRPLQPPLPLVLRPPLRKKKSFSRVSRVSTWLFPAGEQPPPFLDGTGQPVGFDQAVTNSPRPVRGDEGFYQCVSPSSAGSSSRQHGRGGPLPRRQQQQQQQHQGRGRNDAYASSASSDSWETEDDERTMPTTWSPGSSPAARTAADGPGSSLFDRAGKDAATVTSARRLASNMAPGARRESVGVAF